MPDEWAAAARARVAANIERYGLSPQQRRVAWCLFTDTTAAEIGYTLGLAESSVRNYATIIAEKLGTHSSRLAIVLKLLDIEGVGEMKPEPNDELFVGRDSAGAVTEAFRRTPGGNMADITGSVERVEVSNESFTVYGKRVPHGPEPWTATCDRDAEATDAMLRGVVRFSDSAGWAL